MTSEDNEASKFDSKATTDVMLVPPPSEEKSTNSVSAVTQQKRGVVSEKVSAPVVINDGDLPSSTPVPPPLNVPIVTHSARPTEGTVDLYRLNLCKFCMQILNKKISLFFPNCAVQSLYDERVQTRVRIPLLPTTQIMYSNFIRCLGKESSS